MEPVNSDSTSVYPEILAPQIEETPLRKFANDLLKRFPYFSFLQPYVDWLAPEYHLESRNEILLRQCDPRMGIQNFSAKEACVPIFSGQMTGCHAVIGIDPSGTGFFAHNNPYTPAQKAGCINATKNRIIAQKNEKDTTYYLFINTQTINESNAQGKSPENFYKDIAHEWYKNHISHIIYIDSLGNDSSYLKYLPQSRTLEIEKVEQKNFPNPNHIRKYTIRL